MSLTMHQISIPVFIRALNNLSGLLNKAVAHVEENKLDPDSLLTARLFDDMYPLTGQIQRASDAAKFGASRLSAVQPPSFADEETTFPQLQERIVWPASYSVARSYFDQLTRGSGLSAARLSTIDGQLSAAKNLPGAAQVEALNRLATELEAEAAKAGDPTRVRLLAGVLRDIARAAQ